MSSRLGASVSRTLSQPRLPLPGWALAGYAVKVAAIFIIAIVTWRSLVSRSDAANRTLDTLTTIEQFGTVQATLIDAETGERGFLLTGAESYLEPYTNARTTLPVLLATLRARVLDDPEQRQRFATLEQLVGRIVLEIDSTVARQRAGNTSAAIDAIRSGRGKLLMDEARRTLETLRNVERSDLRARQQDFAVAVSRSTFVSLGGSAIILLLIGVMGVMTSRDFVARETEIWLRGGLATLRTRIQGDLRLDDLGNRVLEFLANYVNAQVGVAYVSERGTMRRIASWALPANATSETVSPGEGLLGQAAKENRVLHVTDVPAGYLPIASSLGTTAPREVLVAPAAVDGRVQAVIELGFLHRITPAERELLERVSESLGAAVRSSRDRSRLEELLEETQRQAEELQVQQEELKVSNEELEENSRALRESSARLESQQAELEQTNTHLEEQAQQLEAQSDELTRSQAGLAERAADLERANQYKSEFLANMSHELRTPLNSTLILAKLLADNREGNLTAEQVRFANTISSAGNDLLALINDILDLSKIEAGKMEVSSAPIAVPQLLEDLLLPFGPMAAERGIGLHLELGDGLPAQIESDAQRLSQILRNLLSNALKFTERGSVTVRAAASGDAYVAFAVSDTGIGIAPAQHGVIFEAFRQADGSTHRKYGGTGLGLSISRDLAHLLSGDITVESEPGRGSTFTLIVPVRWSAPASQPVTRAATPMAPPAIPPVTVRDAQPAKGPGPSAIEDDRERLVADARTILVVEDDVRFAEILRDLARQMGFLCIVTHSANDGLQAAVLYRPSAILLDINLPDHSGLGVLDQLKRDSRTRHIPVHVASVADYSHEALERGAVGYALKPVKREDLVEAFKRLEAKVSQSLRRVLVVEDDARQRESIRYLLSNGDVEIVTVANAADALSQLRAQTFDCVVMDLNLPDVSGYELLERMAAEEDVSFPPVIIYTGRALSRDEEQRLQRFSRSIIIKDARSPERLLDEVTLFLHQVESALPAERQRMLRVVRDREATFEGRRILIVEDDARNIFALTSVLEPKGAVVEIARNGREALDVLQRRSRPGTDPIDLVLMDIMMPEMDGLTAMRAIRQQPTWRKLPIIALTAKAMRDDQEECLAAGANDYIAKPLDVERLLSLVRVWLPRNGTS